MKEVTALEIVEQLDQGEQLHLIDVREADEVAEGIIPGAIHIPLGEVPSRVNELNKATAYVVVCAAGGRSARAVEYLTENGYDATNMLGGMMAWTGEIVVS